MLIKEMTLSRKPLFLALFMAVSCLCPAVALSDDGETTSRLTFRDGALRLLPIGDVFSPLIADPKERQFFLSFLGLRTSINHMTSWSVGFGESLGLARWDGRHVHSQVGILAGVFSQFNWSSASRDLINTDFTFGLSTTHRWKALSGRVQVFHQSSHLGDELLLYNPIPRLNVSYEALEAIFSLENKSGRVYCGGERLISRDPTSLRWDTLHSGMELWGKNATPAFFRPIAGLDVKWKQQQNWYGNVSLKAGLEMGKPTPQGRRLRLLAEFYHGYSPYGQFYTVMSQSLGLGFYLGF
jgi:hypothetical protein